MALFSRPPITIRDQHFPGRAPIDYYGNGRFSFAEMSHNGSLLCLPSGIFGWSPASLAEMDEVTFAPIFNEADGIEILVVGCGNDIGAFPRDLRDKLRAVGIGLEIMATGPAVRTYNILLSEDRPVAAALIAV
jgi:uncharacterized protein